MKTRLLLLSIFMVFKMFSMDTRVHDTRVMDIDLEKAETFANEDGIGYLERYYDQPTSTLNLQNLGLTDDLLHSQYKSIKRFINLTKTENLILERNNLTSIPYYLITFALINKNIRYLSLKHNMFNIPLMIVQEDMQPELAIPLEAIRSIEFTILSSEVKEALSRNRSNSIAEDDHIGMISNALWKSISPEIEQAIKKYNIKKRDRFLYKKIIVIDSKIPPITIIDYQDLPKSKKEIIKDLCFKLSCFLVGVSITILPQIVRWIVEESSETVPETSNSL